MKPPQGKDREEEEGGGDRMNGICHLLTPSVDTKIEAKIAIGVTLGETLNPSQAALGWALPLSSALSSAGTGSLGNIWRSLPLGTLALS